jgi:hypothetical protein
LNAQYYGNLFNNNALNAAGETIGAQTTANAMLPETNALIASDPSMTALSAADW